MFKKYAQKQIGLSYFLLESIAVNPNRIYYCFHSLQQRKNSFTLLNNKHCTALYLHRFNINAITH